MKKIYILSLVLLFNLFSMQAQEPTPTDVASIEGVIDMMIDGGSKYVVTHEKIMRLDLSVTPATTTTIYTSTMGTPSDRLLRALAVDMGTVFVSTAGENAGIYRITGGTATKIITAHQVTNMKIINGQIYYISVANDGKSVLSRVSTSGGTPVVISEWSSISIGPTALAVNNGELYYAEPNGNISKISSPATASLPTYGTPVASGLGYVGSMAFDGNNMFVSQPTANAISKVDLSASPSTVDKVLTTTSYKLEIYGGDLYFSGANSIKKVAVSALLSNEAQQFVNLVLSPNPVHHYVKIKGLQGTQQYAIYSVLGQRVLNGEVSTNQSISVGSLNQGLYFLQLNKGQTLKFLKQ